MTPEMTPERIVMTTFLIIAVAAVIAALYLILALCLAAKRGDERKVA